MFDTTLRKNGQRGTCSACPCRADVSASQASTAAAESVPARQQQPALRPAEHPGNRAQVLDALRGLRDAGRLPMLSSAISAIGVVVREILDEPGRVVDQRAIGPVGDARRARRGPRSTRVAPAESFGVRSSLASSVAATSASRLRRASSGSEYLLAMISPCSVRRSLPVHAARGCARIASIARTAAAADRAAAAVEQAQRDAVSRGTRRPARSRPRRAPTWRSDSRRPCCCPNTRASLPASRRARRPWPDRPARRTPSA